jgi:hypothetical protein
MPSWKDFAKDLHPGLITASAVPRFKYQSFALRLLGLKLPSGEHRSALCAELISRGGLWIRLALPRFGGTATINSAFSRYSGNLDSLKGAAILNKYDLSLSPSDRVQAALDLKDLNSSGSSLIQAVAESPAAKFLGRAATPVGAVLSGVGEYDTARDNKKSVTDATVRAGAAAVFDTGTALAFAYTGAAIGTFLGPEGTIAGGVIGGIIGAAASIPVTNIFNNAINWF